MEVSHFKLNQVVIHCLTSPRKNFIDLSGIENDFRVTKQKTIVLTYPNFTTRITKTAYIVIHLFNNIFSVYNNLVQEILKVLVEFINKFAKDRIIKVSYSIRNIHLSGSTNFHDQSLIQFCRSLQLCEFVKRENINYSSTILDTDGLPISIDVDIPSFKSVRLNLRDLNDAKPVKLLVNFTFGGYMSIIATGLTGLSLIEDFFESCGIKYGLS